MSYLYHLVPKDFTGDTVFPLNKLKDIFPDLYNKKIKKYEGREKSLENVIPVLNCLWNDTIHFSPVHPKILKESLIEAGMKNVPLIEYFQIDPHLLNPQDTIVYLYRNDPARKMDPDNFASFDADKVAQYSEIPNETIEYFKEMISGGKNPLGFHKIPHILYKGTLNIKDLNRMVT